MTGLSAFVDVSRHNTVVLLAVVAGAALLTLKYFPGLENEAAYAGNVFQTLHPDAFTGDPYRDPTRRLFERPFQLSLFYLLVKFTGEIWLDDRFVALVYWGLVAASLAGVDAIARLLGAAVGDRLLLLMLFLKDHQILGNKVLLAHHPDVNHFAFAIPIIIWITYAALARKGLLVIGALAVVLFLVSVRNAPFPVGAALVLTAVRGGRRERMVVGMLAILGLTLAAWLLATRLAISDDYRLMLWDMIREREHSAANPFHPNDMGPLWLQNGLFLALIAAASLLARGVGSGRSSWRDVRVIFGLGLALWLVGGLYISFSPDSLKMPILIGLAPARALALPQNLAYIVVVVALCQEARQSPGPRSSITLALGVGALFLAGPGSIGRWGMLLAVAALLVISVQAIRGRDDGMRRAVIEAACQRPLPLILATLVVVLLVSYVDAARRTLPNWAVLARTGVFGAADSAKWIGVAEYLRSSTPADAAVLPLFFDPSSGQLVPSSALVTRSGRPQPTPQPYSRVLDPSAWTFERQQREVIDRLAEGILQKNVSSVMEQLPRLVPVPRYLIVPTRFAAPLIEGFHPRFVEERRVGEYSILRTS